MKIRVGFVSNSSSSSFCIYKKLMTNKQIDEFREIIKSANRNDEETSLGEDGNYFIGELSIHNDEIPKFLEKNFKREDWGDYC
jgi:hypothetical protein